MPFLPGAAFYLPVPALACSHSFWTRRSTGRKSGDGRGGKLGADFLDHRGSRAGTLTGDLQSFNGLDGGGLMNRSQLYQLWLFKTFLQSRLAVRIGEVVPTYQFRNIADVTSLIMTPIFVMPTVLGRMPGDLDSTTGITVAASLVRWGYGKFGIYDGRVGGRRVNTDLDRQPSAACTCSQSSA